MAFIISLSLINIELSEEEKLKKALKEKMKKEYMATLKKEGKLLRQISIVWRLRLIGIEDMLFRMRVELVKQVANKVIQDLKNKADNTYKEMDDKLGERFLKEMDSIKMLCNFIKFSIENKQKIKRELVLMQDEFLIDDVRIGIYNFHILLFQFFLLAKRT